MKLHSVALLAAGLTFQAGVLGQATPQNPAGDSTLKDTKSKVSYSIGLNLGNNFRRQGVEVDHDNLLRGIKDAMSGATPLLNEQQVQEVLSQFQKEMRAKQEEQQKVAGEKNLKTAQDFLAENKAKPGVVTLPSGLQYKILQEGNGASPKEQDTVTVNYRGTLIDGTEFDSSYKRGQPATFTVNGVIKGWTEALQLMKPGAKWQLFIPPDLAYGPRGAGQNIGPNSALIFEVELISVTPAAPPQASQPITSDIIKVPSAEELKKGAKIEILKPEDVERLQKEAAQKEAEKKK